MTRSNFFLNKIYKNSTIIVVVLMIMSYILTGEIIYSFISLFAAITGIFGFFLSIKTLDRFLKNKKGQVLLFFVFFLKLIIISVGFFIISRISDKAVLFYIAGISVIVLSMMFEGFLLLINKKNNLNDDDKLINKNKEVINGRT